MASRHILVVGTAEDEVKNIDYLLEFSGCRVTLVRDVREAVEMMIVKKSLFHSLDLILINSFFALVQFMDIFNGTITLREKYPIVVIDKFNLKARFREMFHPLMEEFNIRLCDSDCYLAEIEDILNIRFSDVAVQ